MLIKDSLGDSVSSFPSILHLFEVKSLSFGFINCFILCIDRVQYCLSTELPELALGQAGHWDPDSGLGERPGRSQPP